MNQVQKERIQSYAEKKSKSKLLRVDGCFTNGYNVKCCVPTST